MNKEIRQEDGKGFYVAGQEKNLCPDKIKDYNTRIIESTKEVLMRVAELPEVKKYLENKFESLEEKGGYQFIID